MKYTLQLLKQLIAGGSTGSTTSAHHHLATGSGHILIGLVATLIGESLGSALVGLLLVLIILGGIKEWKDYTKGNDRRKVAKRWDWLIDFACYFAGGAIGLTFLWYSPLIFLATVIVVICINVGTTVAWIKWNRDSRQIAFLKQKKL